MSWITRIQNDLIIRTGDGKTYRPSWLNAGKGVEYNVAEFDFVGVRGTLVKRHQPKGRKFPIELYFHGEDHLDTAEAFEQSANDPRPWVLSHPFYGQLSVQPSALAFDNTAYNVTKITGTLLETLSRTYPQPVQVPQDQIAEQYATANASLSAAYGNNVTPGTADISQMQSTTAALYDGAVKSVDEAFAPSYFNAFKNAQAAIANGTAYPLEAAQKMQALITAPSLFATTAQQRVTLLQDSYISLRTALITGLTKAQKFLFHANAGATITAMVQSAATPMPGDYGNRNDALEMIENLLGYYDQYLTDLDNLQSANGGNPDSFLPDAQAMQDLSQLVSLTISNLYDIALDGKQERSIVLEKDSNWILLAHRFYGLDAADENIETLIANNNAGLSEMLEVKKNRLVTYYV